MQISNSQRSQQSIAQTELDGGRTEKSRIAGAIASSVSFPATGSIASLNEQIENLEQNGESSPGQLETLRADRNEAIQTYTGAEDVTPYDTSVVAAAQKNDVSYNNAVTGENIRRQLSSMHRPEEARVPMLDKVENLPWEKPFVNARVDELTFKEGLSFDAAIVIAMTERKPSWEDLNPTAEPGAPSIQGAWQAGFADRVVKAGPEISNWATSLADPAATGTIALTAGSDNVTVTQRGDGMLVIRDNNRLARDTIVDPQTQDRIVILGGAGNDTITIDKSVTANMVIAGGDGDDKIFGGAGNDILIGGDGHDLIRGYNGTDIIVGGNGNDNMEGEHGGDIILGEAGADYGSGGSGNDLVMGGDGRDSLYGGHSQDMIFGGGSDDNINGGRADDFLDGGTGDDSVIGGKGDDNVQGGSGDDTLIGTSGNDVYTDAELGDHVILENGETAGSAGATSEIVEIDASLGKPHELLAPGNRFEFRIRVEDDLELLRSVRSGQDMLTGLAGITQNTGNRTLITELDPIEDIIELDGKPHSTEGGFVSWTTTDFFTEYGGTPAPGTDSLVHYNTSTNIDLRESTGPQAVPPVVVLFHEMSHAFNLTSGTADLHQYSMPGEVDFGVNNLERQAVGLSVSVDGDGNPLTVDPEDKPNIVSVNVDLDGDGITDIVIDQPTENDLRSDLGMGDRISYRL